MQITSNTHSYSVHTNDKATKQQDSYNAAAYRSVVEEEEVKTYSVFDDFLQDILVTNATQLQSTLMQDTLKQKVNEYAQVMLQKSGDMPQNELEKFKSSFKEKYDNALYAREIHDKYADEIFDHSLLDAMDKTKML
ncbi:MAG: hypothetical protein RBS24_06745 [Bacilli bacterium]|jgi:hypothetical protein|nr:hypothetical protein [Bacilli bacterium]